MPDLDLTNLTATEIDNLKVGKEKELKKAQESLYEVEQKELEVSKRIVVLQAEKKDYQIAASRARQIVRTINLDIKILTSAFWNARNGGV
jgi:hypothetical protein